MYAEYCSKRAATVAGLEALPLRAWARTGRHTEFGRVTVLQQVGYFAYHEVYHYPDFVEKRRASFEGASSNLRRIEASRRSVGDPEYRDLTREAAGPWEEAEP